MPPIPSQKFELAEVFLHALLSPTNSSVRLCRWSETLFGRLFAEGVGRAPSDAQAGVGSPNWLKRTTSSELGIPRVPLRRFLGLALQSRDRRHDLLEVIGVPTSVDARCHRRRSSRACVAFLVAQTVVAGRGVFARRRPVSAGAFRSRSSHHFQPRAFFCCLCARKFRRLPKSFSSPSSVLNALTRPVIGRWRA